MSSGFDEPDQSDKSTASSYFLRDEPANITETDEFGHYQYVETLTEIITEVDLPWQIALFGRWGTGKSSILGAIAAELPTREGVDESSTKSTTTDDSKVEYVEFDAWKHAEDSIRTEFLLTLDQKLCRDDDQDGLLGETRITEELYDVTVAEETERIDPPQKIQDIPYGFAEHVWNFGAKFVRSIKDNGLLSVSIFITGIVVVAEYFGWISINDDHISTIVTALALPLLIYLLKELSGPKGTYQRMISPRKEWSGAYEDIFKEILDENNKQNGEPDRYVIAIDNLDRCEAETVYDVLIAMKTFFSDDRCVYIVPCDGHTLRQHVASISVAERESHLGEAPISDDDEFLRKFFQTTIQLPPLEVQNVESFANQQINELRPGRRPNNQAEVVDVLTKFDVRTPRHIKHTINRFLSLREIAKRLEDAGHLEHGSVTRHEAFLVKILLIKEEFPEVYQLVHRDPELLTKLHEAAQTIDINEEDVPESSRENVDVQMASDGGVELDDGSSSAETPAESITSDPVEILRKEPRLHSFLKNTKECYRDPHPFIYLGDASFTKLFGRFSGFRAAVRDGASEDALNELRSVSEPQTEDIDRLVSDILTRISDETTLDPSTKSGSEPAENDTRNEETDDDEYESSEIVTAVGTIFELIPQCETAVAHGLIDGVQVALGDSVIREQLFEFNPEGVWRMIVRREREADTQNLTDRAVEHAISERLRDRESSEYRYFSSVVESIEANPDSDYEQELAQQVRGKIQPLFEELDSGQASRNVGHLLGDYQQATPHVLTNSLYRSLVELLPTSSSSPGIDSEVFETLLKLDALLDDAAGIDETEITKLSDTFVCTVLEESLVSPRTIKTEPVARLKGITSSHISEEVGWEIHRRVSTVFEQSSSAQITEECFDLVDLWLQIHEDVIGYGRPPAERPEFIGGQREWETIHTVEDTFVTLFENLQDRAVVEYTEKLVERELDVFNKHAVLSAFLQYVPDLLSDDQLIIDVLELVDEGELAPVEQHVEKCLDDDYPGRVAQWARVAVEVPTKFEGVQDEFVRECVSRCEHETARMRVHLLPYPVELYTEFRDQPTLQKRILDVIRESITARRRREQRAAALALRRLDTSVPERDSLLTRAAKLVEREYRSGNRPDQALETLVLTEEETALVTSIHEARFSFVRSTADDAETIEEQKEALNVLLDYYEELPPSIDRDVLAETIKSLEQRYRVDSPFKEQIDQLKQLNEANASRAEDKFDE